MESSDRYFFSKISNSLSSELVAGLKEYAETNKKEVYCLIAPLMEERYSYDFIQGWSLLIPGYPIMFINDKGNEEEFNDYVDDYLEDLSHIADKFNFAEKLGRRRSWTKYYRTYPSNVTLNDILKNKLDSERDRRVMDIFISLILGCYNDAAKIEVDCGDNLLIKIKSKILLFDCNQTRFLYQDPPKEEKVIYIQGLAGTGKTELLLHKLKNLYLKEDNNAVFGFTCFNKVLASVLRSRINDFFNQMGANKQIDWEGNMLCTHAWGSWGNPRSGILRYICNYYSLPWYSLSDVGSLEKACEKTLSNLKLSWSSKEKNFCFSYLFIDESQDFPKAFIDLCSEVTESRVYVAGDIFQNIFTVHHPSLSENAFQILLNQCYRTDPRTFMFAHAMGMGLLEKKKISWLPDEDWEKCGYEVKSIENGAKYQFSRRPIRRFEDLGNDYAPMKIYRAANHMAGIIKEIDEWKDSFSNLTPDDIAVIFLDSESYIYEQAPKIADYIKRKYNWDTNLAYLSKRKIPNTVFITNRNNVKGLEFPFVFCLTSGIKNDMVYRHTLYTMLSRSHVRSVLIFNDTSLTLKQSVEEGINEIMNKGYMTITVPTEKEQKDIQMQINSKSQRRSLEERINEILIIESIPYDYWERINITLNSLKDSLENLTEDQLKQKIRKAWELVQPD